MTDTTFFVRPHEDRYESFKSRFVSETGPNDTITFGEGGEADFLSSEFAQASRESGGGGSISTAKDYLKFLNMLRRQGVAADGTRLMRRWTVRMGLQSRHLRDPTEDAYGSVTALNWSIDVGWTLLGSYSDGTFIFDDARALPVKDLIATGHNPSASATRVSWGGLCGTYWSVDLDDDLAISGQTCTRPNFGNERKIDAILHDYLE